jgi:hypothetical protein
MFPRCSAALYESLYGLPVHTNCQDIQAEAQREYGLTPDDVHDSFNLFMHTGVDAAGRLTIDRQRAKAGDYVDLLAVVDVLAVPNVCGSDLMRTSNFSIKPVKLSVLAASEAQLAAVPPFKPLASNRTPAQFRNSRIKPDRELRRDRHYEAVFTNVPIEYRELQVPLSAQDYALLEQCRRSELYGNDDGAALRDIVFSWWEERFLRS